MQDLCYKRIPSAEILVWDAGTSEPAGEDWAAEMSFKFQRIRDPLHNLIEFQADEFHDAMWKVIQSHQFQRLRRIKQLGFSEIVYPGATHTRFAHSVGVFHTARRLMEVINKHRGNEFKPTQAHIALAAALVHDVGHGPYSHAFEDVGKKLKLAMADHEKVTDLLIRDDEIGEALKVLGGGFAADVADLIKKAGPATIYSAVVSSQFDADRLDYMQRDRLMTGTHHGAIDFHWLLSNLEVGSVSHGVDSEIVGDIETFVLGPKALLAAETYLLGLFQLYATVYFHKATRGAEKLFTELLARLFTLALEGSAARTGLSDRHPLIRFAKYPEDLKCTLALDDSVIGGALFMMTEAEDALISDFSRRLRDRRLLKCIDLRETLGEKLRSLHAKKSAKSKSPKAKGKDKGVVKQAGPPMDEQSYSTALDRACKEVEKRILAWDVENCENVPRILLDRTERSLYKPFEESKGPLEQIMIKTGMGNGKPVDVASISQVIKAIAPFKVLRVYMKNGDEKEKIQIDQIIEEEVIRCGL